MYANTVMMSHRNESSAGEQRRSISKCTAMSMSWERWASQSAELDFVACALWQTPPIEHPSGNPTITHNNDSLLFTAPLRWNKWREEKKKFTYILLPMLSQWIVLKYLQSFFSCKSGTPTWQQKHKRGQMTQTVWLLNSASTKCFHITQLIVTWNMCCLEESHKNINLFPPV